MTVELYRDVDGEWCQYGVYDLATKGGVESYTEAVEQFGKLGRRVKVKAMKKWRVSFVSGFTLKFKELVVDAVSEDAAVEKAFDREGRAFENRLVGVTEVCNA